jgi:hypothetical protein
MCAFPQNDQKRKKIMRVPLDCLKQSTGMWQGCGGDIKKHGGHMMAL